MIANAASSSVVDKAIHSYIALQISLYIASVINDHGAPHRLLRSNLDLSERYLSWISFQSRPWL